MCLEHEAGYELEEVKGENRFIALISQPLHFIDIFQSGVRIYVKAGGRSQAGHFKEASSAQSKESVVI